MTLCNQVTNIICHISATIWNKLPFSRPTIKCSENKCLARDGSSRLECHMYNAYRNATACESLFISFYRAVSSWLTTLSLLKKWNCALIQMYVHRVYDMRVCVCDLHVYSIPEISSDSKWVTALLRLCIGQHLVRCIGFQFRQLRLLPLAELRAYLQSHGKSMGIPIPGSWQVGYLILVSVKGICR